MSRLARMVCALLGHIRAEPRATRCERCGAVLELELEQQQEQDQEDTKP